MRSPEISQDALPRGAFEPECGVASQPRFADVEQSRTFEFRGRSQPAVNGGHVDGEADQSWHIDLRLPSYNGLLWKLRF